MNKLREGFCKPINNGETLIYRKIVFHNYVYLHKYFIIKPKVILKIVILDKVQRIKIYISKWNRIDPKMKFIDNACIITDIIKIVLANQIKDKEDQNNLKTNDICLRNFELAKELALIKRRQDRTLLWKSSKFLDKINV